MTKKERVFITGAAGFVGSNLTRKCVESGFDVNILLKSSSDTSRIRDLLPRIRTYYGNLVDADHLRRIFDELKPYGVFHLAASPIMSGAMASPEEVIRSNILGTVNLMNVASNFNLAFFLNTGTFLEYVPVNRALKESDPCEPSDLYSISKLVGTLYGRSIANSKNIPVVTIRLFTPYGPGIQKGRLVYEIVAKALQNKQITLTAPTVSRDFIFIEDLTNLYLEAASKAQSCIGGVFNGGSGTVTTLSELSQLILEITKSESEVIWGTIAPTTYDATPWQADMTKTCSTFSWRPSHDLTSGLKETVDWYKNFIINRT